MGQTMITTAFLSLLVLSAITVNRMLIDSKESEYKTTAYSEAIDIAHDLLLEATSRKFDEKAKTTDPQKVSEFTSSTALGAEGSEEKVNKTVDTAPFQSLAKFDDVDDYHGYIRAVDGSTISDFTVSATVYYVNVTSPHAATTSRTYMKRIVVTVTHPLYLDSFTLSRYVAY